MPEEYISLLSDRTNLAAFSIGYLRVLAHRLYRVSLLTVLSQII